MGGVPGTAPSRSRRVRRHSPITATTARPATPAALCGTITALLAVSSSHSAAISPLAGSAMTTAAKSQGVAMETPP